jgi:hypothetical protein
MRLSQRKQPSFPFTAGFAQRLLNGRANFIIAFTLEKEPEKIGDTGFQWTLAKSFGQWMYDAVVFHDEIDQTLVELYKTFDEKFDNLEYAFDTSPSTLQKYHSAADPAGYKVIMLGYHPDHQGVIHLLKDLFPRLRRDIIHTRAQHVECLTKQARKKQK